MKYLKLTPLDTLFFRDGSPFTAGETGQMEVRGHFPPSPTTVVGALRAAFARELDWTGGAWGPDVTAKLGDGDELKPLSFVGPYLLRCGTPLFPAPLHLLRAKGKDGEKDTLTFLEPGDEIVTDLGPARLPEPQNQGVKGFKTLEDAFLTLEAMQTVLNGKPPDLGGIVEAKTLWGSEARVGIHRNDETRTTKEDALYQTAHVRLARGVSLVMGVSGLEVPAPDLLTLGGESRMARLERADFNLPNASASGNRYTVTLITPGCFAGDGWRTPGGALPGLPGHIVSACVGKPVLIGGWDSEAKRPKALEPHLPPGSVFFMEADDAQAALEMHSKHIGEKTAWGYGQILIGAWG